MNSPTKINKQRPSITSNIGQSIKSLFRISSSSISVENYDDNSISDQCSPPSGVGTPALDDQTMTLGRQTPHQKQALPRIGLLGAEDNDDPNASFAQNYSPRFGNRGQATNTSPHRASQRFIGVNPEEFIKRLPAKQEESEKRIVEEEFDIATSLPHSRLSLILKAGGGTFRESTADKFIISTSSYFYQVFKLKKIGLSFLSSFHYAYIACFFDAMSESEQSISLTADWVYDALFFLDIVTNFFTEHHYPGSNSVERNLKNLFWIYVQGRLTVDILSLLPLFQIFRGLIDTKMAKLFFLIKLLRLVVAFQLIDHKVWMKQVKQIYHSKMLTLIEEKPQLAESQEEDNTNITKIVLVSHLLKTAQLTLFILCGSYFTGLLWFVYCDIELHLMPSLEENFIQAYAMNENESQTNTIAMTYFIFTSLSTVGLGDFHPKSSAERLICAFILLFGVAVTSYIMGNLNEMIRQLKEFNVDFEEESKLSQFVGTLERFNYDSQIESSFQQKMEHYFEYRWKYNKRNALSSSDDLDLMAQLPQIVQCQIYSDFLYKDFLIMYSKYFKNFKKANLKLVQTTRTVSRFKEDNLNSMSTNETGDAFLEFQTTILRNLEPMVFFSKEIIHGQKQFVDEIIFLTEGKVDVGYNHEFFLFEKGFKSEQDLAQDKIEKKTKVTLLAKSLKMMSNKQKREPRSTRRFRYPLEIKPGQAFGVYEMCHDKPSHLIYKTSKETKFCHVLFIRRQNWARVLQETSHLGDAYQNFKKFCLIDYIINLYMPIARNQKTQLEFEEQKVKLKKTLKPAPSKPKNAMLQVPQASRSPDFFQKHQNELSKILEDDDDALLAPKTPVISSKGGLRLEKIQSSFPKEYTPQDLNSPALTLKKHPNSYMTGNLGGMLHEQKSKDSRISGKTSSVRKRETSILPIASLMQEIEDPELKEVIQKNEREEIGNYGNYSKGETSNLSDFITLSQYSSDEISHTVLAKQISKRVDGLQVIVGKLLDENEKMKVALHDAIDLLSSNETRPRAGSLALSEYADQVRLSEQKQKLVAELMNSVSSSGNLTSTTPRELLSPNFRVNPASQFAKLNLKGSKDEEEQKQQSVQIVIGKDQKEEDKPQQVQFTVQFTPNEVPNGKQQSDLKPNYVFSIKNVSYNQITNQSINPVNQMMHPQEATPPKPAEDEGAMAPATAVAAAGGPVSGQAEQIVLLPAAAVVNQPEGPAEKAEKAEKPKAKDSSREVPKLQKVDTTKKKRRSTRVQSETSLPAFKGLRQESKYDSIADDEASVNTPKQQQEEHAGSIFSFKNKSAEVTGSSHANSNAKASHFKANEGEIDEELSSNSDYSLKDGEDRRPEIEIDEEDPESSGRLMMKSKQQYQSSITVSAGLGRLQRSDEGKEQQDDALTFAKDPPDMLKVHSGPSMTTTPEDAPHKELIEFSDSDLEMNKEGSWMGVTNNLSVSPDPIARENKTVSNTELILEDILNEPPPPKMEQKNLSRMSEILRAMEQTKSPPLIGNPLIKPKQTITSTSTLKRLEEDREPKSGSIDHIEEDLGGLSPDVPTPAKNNFRRSSVIQPEEVILEELPMDN